MKWFIASFQVSFYNSVTNKIFCKGLYYNTLLASSPPYMQNFLIARGGQKNRILLEKFSALLQWSTSGCFTLWPPLILTVKVHANWDRAIPLVLSRLLLTFLTPKNFFNWFHLILKLFSTLVEIKTFVCYSLKDLICGVLFC